jgi:hypothetical protein
MAAVVETKVEEKKEFAISTGLYLGQGKWDRRRSRLALRLPQD